MDTDDLTGEQVVFTELGSAALPSAARSLEDGAFFKEAAWSLWEQPVASCSTLLLLMLADAPLAEETLDKQVVPGRPCALLCFAEEWFTSSSQEQMVAARLARRPFLPSGAAEASDGLGGEAAFSSGGTAGMSEISGISSVTSLLSQWRRCAASFCIRVLTEEAAGASGLEFSPLGMDGASATESLAGAGAGAGARAGGCA